MLECIAGENKEIKRHYGGRREMRIKRIEGEKGGRYNYMGGREREVEKREGEESYKMRNGAWYLRE